MKKHSIQLSPDGTDSATPPAIVLPTSLASIAAAGALKATVEYKDGLKFNLCYMTKAALNRIVNASIVQKYVEAKKSRQPQLDNDLFLPQFCSQVVEGWEGATLRVLSGLAPLNTSGLTKEQLDAPYPFSQESLLFLVKTSYDLDEFLQASAVDVKLFRPNLEEATKNS